jgi:hypothetical protein
MSSSHQTSHFAMQLLRQDQLLNAPDYREYRMKLENALTAAERREKLAAWIAGVSFVVALVLMFVGGSKAFGGFDPWNKEATYLSVTLGVLYAIAMIAWPVALAVGFSRFRPRIREIKEQIRDTSILTLQAEIAELRKQIAGMSRGNDRT